MTLSPLLTASFAIQVHAILAIFATVLGGAILFRRKGTPNHRLWGRVWVAVMAIVALSSFFITGIRDSGNFSTIHILSVLTIVGLVGGVNYARKGRIAAHISSMRQIYFMGLGIAGSFSFMPDRLMNEVFFGGGSWEGFWLVVALALIAFGAIFMRTDWQRPNRTTL